MKKILLYILIIFSTAVLFLFPSWCADGVKLGINLLLYSLLPAILPFMLFSNFLIKSDISHLAGAIIHPLFGRIFKTSKNGSYALIMGFLCGYPLGAKIINDLILEKKISMEEGKYLFKFINNPGPAFIQGYVISSVCAPKSLRLPALLLTYLPSIIIGLVVSRRYPVFKSERNTDESVTMPFSKIVDDSIFDAFATTARLAGYLIIFSIISTLVINIPGLPYIVKNITVCLLEITSGIYYISLTNLPVVFQLFFSILCSIAGGFSILFQINSVVTKSGLDIRECIKYKILAMVICTGLFFIYLGIAGF